MTCHDLSDRMPAVAQGKSSWAPAEAAHLASCNDCGAEFALVQAGAGLASGVTLDADRLAEAVLQRLRTEPVRHRPARRFWLVGLAAAAVVALVLIPRVQTSLPAPAPATEPYAVHLPGLDGLSDEGLHEMLESLDPSWTDTPTIDAPSLDDLDPQELERVQRSWEI